MSEVREEAATCLQCPFKYCIAEYVSSHEVGFASQKEAIEDLLLIVPVSQHKGLRIRGIFQYGT
jgi:hypothetical protein